MDLASGSVPELETPLATPVAIEAAVTTVGLNRHFGDVLAVDELTLCVPRRSLYAFLGPNGAGKTTTIRMLLGLTRPDRGDIRIFGELLTSASRRSRLRRIGALVDAISVSPPDGL